jgi:oligosaccharide reducing-end xylanase
MTLFNKKLFILTFVLLSSTVYSQNVVPPYAVGTWQGFRDAAVCFTFDDGYQSQIKIAVPMFDKYGFKMTMFIIIYWSPTWAALQKAASNGHEIASHTYSHLALSSLNDARQTFEYKKSQEEINTHIKGQKCLTMSYPFCDAGKESICRKYYIAARGCSGKIELSTPSNIMNISSITCGTLGNVKTTKDFCDKADSATASKGLVVFLIHNIDSVEGYSPVTKDNLQGALDYMKLNQNKFWVSTFGNIVRYIKERNSVSVHELAVKDSIISFQLTDALDNTIYNYPVTMRRQLPADWPSAIVSQKGKAINSRTVVIDSTKYIMFDVVPNNGDILIIKNMR